MFLPITLTSYLLALSFLALGWSADASTAEVSAQAQRMVVSLNEGWSLSFGDSTLFEPGAPVVDAGEMITLPHSWNRLEIKGSAEAASRPQGVGIYQRVLTVPEEWRGRSVFLTVGAASLRSAVEVDGHRVTAQSTGCTLYTVDMTRLLVSGPEHRVTIRVASTPTSGPMPVRTPSPGATATPAGVPAQRSNWPSYLQDARKTAGIYRDVWLTVTQPVHVSLTDHASSGVYLQQRQVTSHSALVDARICIANDRDEAVSDVTVEAEILEADGRRVAIQAVLVQQVAAHSSVEVTVPVRIVQPHRWQGRADPYCYRAVVRVRHGSQPDDSVEQPLGLRSFSVDASKGFFLNDQPYDLHGVTLEQDRAGSGWAISDADRAQDVELLKELGATCVRLLHYPHASTTFDLLDKAGIIAWCEMPIPYYSLMPNGPAPDQTLQLDVLKQLYTHPSICFWGLWSERPAMPRRPSLPGAPLRGDQAFVTQFQQLAKQEDPQRLTTLSLASNDDDPLADITDTVAFKRTGWMSQRNGDIGMWSERAHQSHPERCVGLSEYGTTSDVSRHADRQTSWVVQGPQQDTRVGSEEFQAHLHEESWFMIGGKPFLWCTMAATLADYADFLPRGNRMPGLRWMPQDEAGNMGLVTRDRAVRKDAFYWYKACWSSEPVLYLCERRYNPRSFRDVDIRVYSNMTERLALMVNGEVVTTVPEQFGKRSIWSSVRLPAGKVEVVVTARLNGKDYRDSVVWDVPDKLSPNANADPADTAKPVTPKF